MKLQGLFKKIILSAAAIISVIGFGFPLYILIDTIQTELILKNDYIMTGMGITFFLIIIPLLIITILLINVISRILKCDKNLSDNSDIARYIIKRWYIMFPVSALIIAFMTVNFTAVKKNEIVKYGLFHLSGKSYSYADADKIETGFDKDGEFYYNVEIDGKKFKLASYDTSSTNDKYDDSVWSEYRYIDRRIFEMNPDVQKKSSTKGINEYGYSKEEQATLSEIINYKGE